MMARKKGVGYGNPPKEHQFRKGRSGNPKGRPRGARSLRAFIRAELERVYTITENGTVKKVPAKQLIARALVQKAIQGSTQHIDRAIEEDRRNGEGGFPDFGSL